MSGPDWIMSLTPERLAQIEARANAATSGPWEQGAGWVYFAGKYGVGEALLDIVLDRAAATEDLAFIAAAREDVPDLLAEVKRLTAERDRLAATVARVEALCDEARLEGVLDFRPGLVHWQALRAALRPPTDRSDTDE